MGKLYLITGSDEYASKSKAREIIISLCGKDYESDPCLEIIHGDNDGIKPVQAISMIVESLSTPAFLGAKKTVWLKNLDFEKISKLKDSEEFEEIMESFTDALKKELPGDTDLILSILSVDRRSALFKACQKSGEVHFFEKVDIMSKDWNEKLRSVIYESCRDNKVRISEDAVAFVSETASVDAGRVKSELQKLFAYITPRNEISLADCKDICSRTPETAGWSFSNALGERNLKEAIGILNVFVNMDSKNPEMKVIYAVMNHFQDLIKIKAAAQKLSIRPRSQYNDFSSKVQSASPEVKNSMNDNTIFKLNPYRAWKIFESSERFTDKELASIISEVLEVNKALVSGATVPRMELEALAIKICRKNR